MWMKKEHTKENSYTYPHLTVVLFASEDSEHLLHSLTKCTYATHLSTMKTNVKIFMLSPLSQAILMYNLFFSPIFETAAQL